MVQAAASGAVDFSKARLTDRRWWQRLWWLLDRVETDNVVRIRSLEHTQFCAILDYQNKDAFKEHWESAVKSLNHVWDGLFPWRENLNKAGDDYLRQAWVNKYGDPNDPATQMKIAATLEFLKQQRIAAHEERKPKQRKPRRSVIVPSRAMKRG